MQCPGWKPPWAPAEEQAPDEGAAAAGSPPVSAAARAEPAGERSAAAEPRPSAGSPESVEPPEPAERRASGEQRASTDRKVSAERPPVRAGGWRAPRRRGRGRSGAGPRDSLHAPDSPRAGGRRRPRAPTP